MNGAPDSSLRGTIAAEQPTFSVESLSAASWERLERLAQASPLYAQELRRRPAAARWLEEDRNLRTPYRHSALLEEWRIFASASGADLARDEAYVGQLRRWRRLMSMRLAHRSVNGFADEEATAAELSQLAEFCLQECFHLALRRWQGLRGVPWDQQADRPARFCTLALGKLGGEELNFSSDIDLLYCFEGEGFCRREGHATAVANVEFFRHVAEAANRMLTAQTADGFLFRVDTRLRPHGAWGPLVQSLGTIENTYATVGQTWERLALLKARPVAGDLALGAELLEDLHAFRYPRRPPPSLLAEVAATKRRAEQAVASAAAARDVKQGPGGIREIEFIVQSLQLLHAGRYPFLQTNSTARALESLARYRLLEAEEASFLTTAYWHLRRVEHRLQMRDERQTHTVPADPVELAAVSASLGYPSPESFLSDLERWRSQVRKIYQAFFADRPVDPEFEAWWEFFASDRIPPVAEAQIQRWFGDDPEAPEALRLFVCGDHRRQVTAEWVARFRSLALALDALVPEWSQPRVTLSRVGRCAERFATRQQFLSHCASHPQFLRVLALVCDRSAYGAELLAAHPEILEEVIRPAMLRRRKEARDLAAELAAGPPPDHPSFAAWLWLYVRAEQLRYSVEELLGSLSALQLETALGALADAVLTRLAEGTDLLIVALGKYGGGELSFGSDLDLLCLAAPGTEAAAGAQVEALRRTLQTRGPLGPTFTVDLRLRPFGEAGPVAPSLPTLAAYHREGARIWERQVLTQARLVAGPPGRAVAFAAWAAELLYARPLGSDGERVLWEMRARIERERGGIFPPERAFKTGPGGLIDVEFFAQAQQLRHGTDHPALRRPGTRPVLRALVDAGLVPAQAGARLLEHYEHLKRVEFALRRNANGAITVLPASPDERVPLARWLGYPDEAAFWRDHCARLQETRRLVRSLAGPAAERVLPLS